MRDIGSNRITGSEAILVASIVWWFDQSMDLGKYVREALRGADPGRFTSRVDYDLGEALSPDMPVDKVVQSFWDLAKNNATVKHMVEQSVHARRGDDVQEKMDETRAFVRKTIVSELGSIVKESGFLEEHAEAIRAAKRRKIREKKNGRET